MKPTDLPKEKPRVELDTLPQENELLALTEELRAAKDGKTGGLFIIFKDRKGNQFTQKYSAMHSDELTKALMDLKLNDTQDLQKTWFKYKMVKFRMGFPRYIPTKKL